MKKEYVMPAVKIAAIQKPMILAGSSDEIASGGSTNKAPEAKSAFDFDDLEEEPESGFFFQSLAGKDRY